MTFEILLKKAKAILGQIDKDVYPELHTYLTYLTEYEAYENSAYAVTVAIYDCDKKEVMPKEIADLLIEIYEDEVKEKIMMLYAITARFTIPDA